MLYDKLHSQNLHQLGFIFWRYWFQSTVCIHGCKPINEAKPTCSLGSSPSLSKSCGSTIRIMFLHSNIFWAKSSNKLYFFIYIFTTSIHILFGLLFLLGGLYQPLWPNFNFLVPFTGLCCTCPNHLKWTYLIWLRCKSFISTYCPIGAVIIYSLLLQPSNRWGICAIL